MINTYLGKGKDFYTIFLRCISEECRAVGHKEHMPPSEYTPDEIQNSIFLPLMKKALMGGIWGRR